MFAAISVKIPYKHHRRNLSKPATTEPTSRMFQGIYQFGLKKREKIHVLRIPIVQNDTNMVVTLTFVYSTDEGSLHLMKNISQFFKFCVICSLDFQKFLAILGFFTTFVS